jgi:hypothetical protein
MKKILSLIMAIAMTAHANIGWTVQQRIAAWGNPVSWTVSQDALTGRVYSYDFQRGDLYIMVIVINGRVYMESSTRMPTMIWPGTDGETNLP